MVDLLLSEGDKTQQEICQEAISRFGFPQEGLGGNINISLAIKESSRYVSKNVDGAYHLPELCDGLSERTKLLGLRSDIRITKAENPNLSSELKLSTDRLSIIFLYRGAIAVSIFLRASSLPVWYSESKDFLVE